MNVTPVVKFTLLGLSSEVNLRIALKQRKIADFDIVVNYFLSAIAACIVESVAIKTQFIKGYISLRI